MIFRVKYEDEAIALAGDTDIGLAGSVFADARFAFPLGEIGSDVELAPLLCAGLIGWRSLGIAGKEKNIGLDGFGAAAHLIAQVAKWHERSMYAFAPPGNLTKKKFARRLGADWAGGSDETEPVLLGPAIIFATDGDLVPAFLKAIRKGGRLVCASIQISDIPSFPYHLRWEERQLVSVANLTRQDGLDFLSMAPKMGPPCRPRAIHPSKQTKASPTSRSENPKVRQTSCHEPG